MAHEEGGGKSDCEGRKWDGEGQKMRGEGVVLEVKGQLDGEGVGEAQWCGELGWLSWRWSQR